MSEKSDNLKIVRVDPRKLSNRDRNHVPQDVEGRKVVYVNSAFVASTSDVRRTGLSQMQIQSQPVTVYREQYWACSKWPSGQRLLALAVGVLLGAVLGLALALGLRAASGGDIDLITGVFRSVPD